MKMQGEFPVIFLSFKNEKYGTFEEFKYGMKSFIIELYRKNINLLESPKLISYDKQKFAKILSGKAGMVEYYKGLSNLMYYMNIHYNKNVIVFIDEYDVPVQESYLKGYYEDTITAIRVMLTAALKDNVYSEKALITGVLRVAKVFFQGLIICKFIQCLVIDLMISLDLLKRMLRSY